MNWKTGRMMIGGALIMLLFIQAPVWAANDQTGYSYRLYERRVKRTREIFRQEHIQSNIYRKDEKGFQKAVNAYHKKRTRRPSYSPPPKGDPTGRTVVRPPQSPEGKSSR